jgi:hypothetical protein
VRWWIESYNGQLVITDLVNAALQRALRDAAIEIPHPIYDINMISDSHIAD